MKLEIINGLKKLYWIITTNYYKLKKNNRPKKIASNRNCQLCDIVSVHDGNKLLFEVDYRAFATQEIQEPLEHIVKGRTPTKRLKSATETSKRFDKETENVVKMVLKKITYVENVIKRGIMLEHVITNLIFYNTR